MNDLELWQRFTVQDLAHAEWDQTSSGERLERCPELMNRSIPLEHYSKGLLFSSRARAIFVEPDLEPLRLR